MGFDEGRMVLDNPNGVYYPGQTVHGNLIFQQDNVKTFRGIYVKIVGFCKVHWTTSESHTVNGKTETRTRSHDSHEEYLNLKIYLAGGESGKHEIQPGNYSYPFNFHIPPNCPSSFEGEYGHIRYKIKAVVDRSFKLDQEKKIAFQVVAPIDLNIDPYCKEPILMQFNATYCCCCMSSGATDTVIHAPQSGYCPGETIPLEITCTNKGSIGVDHIKISLKKKITFTAVSSPDTREVKETIADIKKSSVPANTTRNWVVQMIVPEMDIYNLSGCSYIDIEYKIKVVVSPEGCNGDSEGLRKIIFGNIPLVGYQNPIPNAPQVQPITQQQIGPVTQQPMLSPYPNAGYPTSSPYPEQAPPYPGGESRYPGQTLGQFPSGTHPYPSANAPYTDNPPPYPGIPMPTPELRTGNIGFIVPGSNVNVPGPPYPVPSVNPYTPNAPAESPDTENQEMRRKK